MSWTKGEMAEDYVAQRLRDRGWTIRGRNFRRKGLELDLIVSQGERLLCIEVKARSKRSECDPAQILGFRKIERLEIGMLLWLQNEAPDERRNTEFWLCLVYLPLPNAKVEWYKI